MRRALVTGILALALVTPGSVFAEEPGARLLADWDTNPGKSYVVPALEVLGFIFGLNQFDRHFLDDEETYDTDWDTFWKNVRTAPEFDKDPFSVKGTALGGVGFGAAGTVGDKEERDYHYGEIPEALLGAPPHRG